MQGLCRIFASNPTQCNVRRINEIRIECRILCRVCRIFISPLFMYVDAACRCISFMTSFSGAPLRPQSSSSCYSALFFALLFCPLLCTVILQSFRLVIPSSSAEFSVVAVLTVSFVQGRSEGDVRVEDFFKERAQVCLHFRCDASEVEERFFSDVEVGIIVFCCSAVDEEECRHERSCDIFFGVFASEEHVGVEAGL